MARNVLSKHQMPLNVLKSKVERRHLLDGETPAFDGDGGQGLVLRVLQLRGSKHDPVPLITPLRGERRGGTAGRLKGRKEGAAVRSLGK